MSDRLVIAGFMPDVDGAKLKAMNVDGGTFDVQNREDGGFGGEYEIMPVPGGNTLMFSYSYDNST